MASTWYRYILILQEPFDAGVDENGRQKVVFNIEAVKDPSGTFIEEIAKILELAGVGTLGTNILAGSITSIPTSGTYLVLIETGGATPENEHNDTTQPAAQRPRMQLSARAATYAAARTLARAAYDALYPIGQQTITF